MKNFRFEISNPNYLFCSYPVYPVHPCSNLPCSIVFRSQNGASFFKAQARAARVELRGVAVSQIAEEVALDVSSRKSWSRASSLSTLSISLWPPDLILWLSSPSFVIYVSQD